jgi:alginate O-acetyltransferase complex protein AlgI
MGIKLMDNFKRPYFSKTISEFWKRWHISLSSWFKDYVYIPLGGNKVKLSRWILNILIVFIVSGLWHGANWTFIIWGALHGVYLVFERILVKTTHIKSKILKNTMACLQIIKTFILVNIGWIFFRANSVSDAIYILKNIFFNFVFNLSLLASEIGINKILYCFTIIGFMELVHIIQEHKGIRSFLDNKPTYIRWGLYIIIILSILLLGVFNNTEFIYFQF